MTHGSPATMLAPIAIAALIAWRFYSRIRRSIGRQPLSNVRPWVTVILFPLIGAALAARSLGHPLLLEALAGGLIVGVFLGLYGLRVTKFEQTTGGLFYTPAAHLGIALSVVLIARIGYRFFQLYSLQASGAVPGGSGVPPGYAQSPLTLLIFGALAGYYVTYAIGLLRWRRQVLSNPLTVAANDSPS